ncbi:membrane protein [Planomonospora sphaerica]|uniref:Membrane protein n=1 Tax=Planomonospora sphaerica TaxID=161355 RepID=A0A171DPP5_9ACTN|nr:SHOCT domain-containing protein [Planomonospora sphaerica]GAT71025.1 membrane protein [Planomonospora sphaerica]
MGWHEHGMSGWGWLAMSIGMVIVWALIIAGTAVVFRYLGTAQRTAAPPAGPSPQDLLAERFARGEIDAEEYRSRLETLRGGGASTTRG